MDVLSTPNPRSHERTLRTIPSLLPARLVACWHHAAARFAAPRCSVRDDVYFMPSEAPVTVCHACRYGPPLSHGTGRADDYYDEERLPGMTYNGTTTTTVRVGTTT
jgi:hypothetical protein